MIKIPYVIVDHQHEARDVYPDSPAILVILRNKAMNAYMRYRKEFYPVDDYSYVVSSYGRWACRRWCIGGVWFNPSSVLWMTANSIALPFSREDFVLYQLTWGDIRE